MFILVATIILYLARILGIIIISYYLGMQLLIFFLILKSGLIRLRSWLINAKRRQKTVVHKKTTTLIDLFQKSLFFNHSLAIGIIIIIAYFLSQIPDVSTLIKLEIFTVIISILPYAFSFTRATNVGLNGGIVGTITGLFLFSAVDPSINWWDKAAYFLIITGLANMSGWIGGWVGPGQIREAVSAIVFKVTMDREGATLSSLVEAIRIAIENIIPQGSKNNHFIDQKPHMVIAQGDNSFSIISFRHELEWRQVIKPQAIALKWLFDKNEYSTNIIIDYVFNLFRAKVTKIILVSKQPNIQNNVVDQGKIYLIVLNYKETPSIVWVDEDVKKLSRMIRRQIRTVLEDEDEKNTDIDWRISQPIESVVRQWLPRIKLEQYSKDTIGANMPYEVIREGKMGRENKIPLEVMDEIIKTPTSYDKFRGQGLAFVSFLFFQIFIGVLINIMSASMYP